MDGTATDTPPPADDILPVHDVHIYRVMRLRFPGIRARTADEAAAQADSLSRAEAAECSDCDGPTIEALVDVAGDAGHCRSRDISFEVGRWLDQGAAMLDRLREAEGFLTRPDGAATPEQKATLLDAIRETIARAAGPTITTDLPVAGPSFASRLAAGRDQPVTASARGA